MHGAYILARYSTDRQNEDSIEVQVEKCSAWCRQNNIPVLDVFADMAVSGMKDTRPQYERMMQKLKNGGADTVVIYDQSRMFRKMTSWFNFRDELENMGVRVVAVTQPTIGGDLRDPSNFLVEGSMALFNQMWVLQTRQKVTEKMRYMAKTGQHTGGVPALGYRVANGHLEVDEAEAETVRLIFRLYAAGYSYREIIETLNQQGRKTKTGKQFGANSLHDLLKNEKYIGVLVYGKTRKRPDGKRNTHGKTPENCIRIENGCPAIVDPKIFEAVQKRLSENRRKGGRPVEHAYSPLKGKAFCGECKSAMNISYSGSSGKYAYYDCAAKHRKHNCNAAPIKKEILETTVANAVRDIFSNQEKRTELLNALRRVREGMQASAGPQMQQMVRRLQDIQKKLDNATDAILNGLNSQAIRDKVTQLEAERDTLRQNIEAYHSQIVSTTIDDGQIDYLLQKAIAVGGADDEAILSMVVRVEVYPTDLKIWTIIDGPPDHPTGEIGKDDVATLVPLPGQLNDDGVGFAHNPGCLATSTKNRQGSSESCRFFFFTLHDLRATNFCGPIFGGNQ